MRLVNTQTLQLEHYEDEDIPAYAILSHTWGTEEISLDDFINNQTCNTDGRVKRGYLKIQSFCQQALDAGYYYIWIDTCCINKASSAELSEAINSMFRWYKDASQCWVYLEDVAADLSDSSFDQEFSASRWFTRGWTLQEMIAPDEVRFYNKDWTFLGRRHKEPLLEKIFINTGVHRDVLSGGDYHRFSVAQRMCWASHRKTSRKEDIAYCLLGLFDVNMPLLYGEGDKAFIRLQREIITNSVDHSIFAWGIRKVFSGVGQDIVVATPSFGIEDRRPGGVLAKSPGQFQDCVNTIASYNDASSRSIYTMTNRGLQISLPLRTGAVQQTYYALLNCTDGTAVLAIPLLAWFNEVEPLEFSRASNLIYTILEVSSDVTLQQIYIADVPPEVRGLRTANVMLHLETLPAPRAMFQLSTPAWSLVESRVHVLDISQNRISCPTTQSGSWNVVLMFKASYSMDIIIILQAQGSSTASSDISHSVFWKDSAVQMQVEELFKTYTREILPRRCENRLRGDVYQVMEVKVRLEPRRTPLQQSWEVHFDVHISRESRPGLSISGAQPFSPTMDNQERLHAFFEASQRSK